MENPPSEEARIHLAFRLLALFTLALLLNSLSPDSSLFRRIVFAADLEAVRKILDFENGQEAFHGLRAFLLLDFLFLSAVGFFLRDTIRLCGGAVRSGVIACYAYMGADFLENVCSLFVLSASFETKAQAATVLPALKILFHLKWLFSAAAHAAGGVFWLRRKSKLVGLAFLAAALAQAIYPFVGGGTVVVVTALAAYVFQLFSLGEIRSTTRLVYFLRIPLLAILLLALFAPVAAGPLRQYIFATLSFKLDLSGFFSMAVCAGFAFLAAFGAAAQAATTLERGHERFDFALERVYDWHLLRRTIQNSALSGSALLMLCAIGFTFSWSSGEFLLALLATLLGLMMAVAIVAVADHVRALFCDLRVDFPTPYLILPRFIATRYERRLDRTRSSKSPAWMTRIQQTITKSIGRLPGSWLIGYRTPDNRIAPEHIFALCFFLLSFVAFFLTVILWEHIAGRPSVPTLTSIILLFLLFSWGLSGFAFFLDRFRVPVLAGALAVRLLLALIPNTDHTFAHWVAAGLRRTPAEVLSSSRDPILIAASGGGIQSAAWTAQILSELRRKFGRGFAERVVLISSVSGGSVGSFMIGSAWASGDWREAALATRESSLGAISSAFVGLDLFRPVTALIAPQSDRGLALEKSLLRWLPKKLHNGITMNDWARKAGEDFPAFLFNATVVETGGPVAFATTQMPSAGYVKIKNPLVGDHVVSSFQSFAARRCDQLKDDDIAAVTAARLSATFPYVSPAARPAGNDKPCNYHFVDGGYYDNYGIVSLIQWLDDALVTTPREGLPNSVTILVIRGQDESPREDRKQWTFANQTSAPLLGFLNMRSYAQWRGGGAALRFFLEKWGSKGVNFRPPVKLPYPSLSKDNPLCGEEPLTWKLTPAQKTCIDYAYEKLDKTALYNSLEVHP